MRASLQVALLEALRPMRHERNLSSALSTVNGIRMRPEVGESIPLDDESYWSRVRARFSVLLSPQA